MSFHTNLAPPCPPPLPHSILPVPDSHLRGVKGRSWPPTVQVCEVSSPGSMVTGERQSAPDGGLCPRTHPEACQEEEESYRKGTFLVPHVLVKEPKGMF